MLPDDAPVSDFKSLFFAIVEVDGAAAPDRSPVDPSPILGNFYNNDAQLGLQVCAPEDPFPVKGRGSTGR